MREMDTTFCANISGIVAMDKLKSMVSKATNIQSYSNDPKKCGAESFYLLLLHGQKSWDTCAFMGRFPIHTGPTPPLTPQTMLDACI